MTHCAYCTHEGDPTHPDHTLSGGRWQHTFGAGAWKHDFDFDGTCLDIDEDWERGTQFRVDQIAELVALLAERFPAEFAEGVARASGAPAEVGSTGAPQV